MGWTLEKASWNPGRGGKVGRELTSSRCQRVHVAYKFKGTCHSIDDGRGEEKSNEACHLPIPSPKERRGQA